MSENGKHGSRLFNHWDITSRTSDGYGSVAVRVFTRAKVGD
jgi:hypothetical protein